MHRPAEFFRRHQERHVFGIGRGFQPERAADVFGDDAQFLFRPTHDAENVLAHGAGALRAGAQRIGVARGIVARGGAARLHRGDAEALIYFRNARDVLGRSEQALDLGGIGSRVGGRPRPIDREVVGRFRPDLRRARFERVARVGHRRERLVLDMDEFGGVLRHHRALGDDHGHGLADMHDAVFGERRPVGDDELCAIAARQRRVPRNIADALHVLRGQYGNDAGRSHRASAIDAHDAGKGMRRAHEISVSLVRLWRIGDIAAAAADQNVVLDAAVEGVGIGVGFGVHTAFRNWLWAKDLGGPL